MRNSPRQGRILLLLNTGKRGARGNGGLYTTALIRLPVPVAHEPPRPAQAEVPADASEVHLPIGAARELAQQQAQLIVSDEFHQGFTVAERVGADEKNRGGSHVRQPGGHDTTD